MKIVLFELRRDGIGFVHLQVKLGTLGTEAKCGQDQGMYGTKKGSV
jgi:hypothetical protein